MRKMVAVVGTCPPSCASACMRLSSPHEGVGCAQETMDPCGFPDSPDLLLSVLVFVTLWLRFCTCTWTRACNVPESVHLRLYLAIRPFQPLPCIDCASALSFFASLVDRVKQSELFSSLTPEAIEAGMLRLPILVCSTYESSDCDASSRDRQRPGNPPLRPLRACGPSGLQTIA
jgi:hypothetical protein